MKSRRSNIVYPEVHVRDVVFFLWRGIRKNWVYMVLIIVGIGAASVFEVIIPLYYKYFFDTLSSGLDKAAIAPKLIRFIFIILGLNGCAWLGWRIGWFSSNKFQAESMASLRQQAYNYLIYHSYSFFTNNFTGALVQRVGRYARAFERLADRIAGSLLPLTVRIVGVVVITWTIEPALSILITSWAVFYMAVNYFYSVWKLSYSIKVAEADSRTTAVLADTITNQNNIDIFSQQRGEAERFKEVTSNQAKITTLSWHLDGGLDSIQAAFIVLIEFGIFYAAINYWQQSVVTLGTFVLIQLYIIGLGSRLWNFSQIIRDFYGSYADAVEMVEIMKLPHEIKDVLGAKVLKVSAGEVVFKDMSFSFNSTREVLKKINLSIRTGEKVALVGPSGAGKTTVVRLLMRFYDVTKGAIMVDGQNIREVTLKSLRDAISLVPQDPLLFHRTIMENIRYGKPSATDADVMRAATLAHCDEFIQDLPKKYETYVGERGIKLSGGERQRVAIARAILKNSPILVLDEATSSLDSHSESLIQDALDTLMEKKTVIVIAHRLSTIKKMDRILVMEDGAIIEEGTHRDLARLKRGLYAKLWKLQAGGFSRGPAGGDGGDNRDDDDNSIDGEE